MSLNSHAGDRGSIPSVALIFDEILSLIQVFLGSIPSVALIFDEILSLIQVFLAASSSFVINLNNDALQQ